MRTYIVRTCAATAVCPPWAGAGRDYTTAVGGRCVGALHPSLPGARCLAGGPAPLAWGLGLLGPPVAVAKHRPDSNAGAVRLSIGLRGLAVSAPFRWRGSAGVG